MPDAELEDVAVELRVDVAEPVCEAVPLELRVAVDVPVWLRV